MIGEAGSSCGVRDAGARQAMLDGQRRALQQPLFAEWSGANGALAFSVCALYVVARALHSAFMLWPRQPLRNRVFGVAQLCLVVALLDAVRSAWGR